MRAFDICIFLLFIGVGISVFGGLTAWGVDEEQGIEPGNAQEQFTTVDLPEPFGSIKGLSAIGLSVAATAIISGMMGAPALQAGGLMLFAGIFWSVWTTTDSVLSTLYLPVAIRGFIGMIYVVSFFIAIAQIAQGNSWRSIE